MQSEIFPTSTYVPLAYRPYAHNPYTSGFSTTKRQRSRSPQYLSRPNWATNNSNTNPNISVQEMKRITESVNTNMYPNGFAELLKNQDKNIKAFKLQINKEKEHLDQDLASFKVEINHTLEDLRLSLHAHLDRVYQTYLEKMAKFKGELFQINRLKEQLEIQLGSALPNDYFYQGKTNKQKSSSQYKTAEKDFNTINPNQSSPNINTNNKANPVDLKMQTLQTISNMQVGNQEFKKYSIMNYITQIQKERAAPLSDLQKQVVFLNSYENGFYQSKEFLKILTSMRDLLSKQTKKIYDNSHRYIRDVDQLIFKQKQENGKVLDGLELNPVNNSNLNPYGQISGSNYYSVSQNLAKRPGTNVQGVISPSQQSLKVNRVQNIDVVEQNSNIQIPGSLGTQTALCGIFINNQIAIGLKDGIIQVLSCDGHNIATLKQHQANICTLAVIRSKNQNYLASGSDVGCCRIVIWDALTWSPKFMLYGHTAAVTGIVDLQDDTYFLSCGYDRKINVYNFEQGKTVFTTQAQCPMIAMLVNKTGTKLVGNGLDKALYVWEIVRDEVTSKTENLILQRKIQNNATINAVVASQIRPELVVIATKDGKIKLVNIDKGQSYKTVSLVSDAQNSIRPVCPLEICLVERQNKPNYPLVVAWPYKQQKLYQANTETSTTRVRNMRSSTGILEYGYGVNPKCILIADNWKGTLLYEINQKLGSATYNCVTVYKLQELK